MTKGEIIDKVDDLVWEQIEVQVWHPTWVKINDQVHRNSSTRISNAIWDQVYNNIGVVKNKIKSQIINQS